MSLLLAPYTHAMRLGQGFNSYTQQICIDDAVVVEELRPENVVTNDGTAMQIVVQKRSAPSAWTRQKEVVVDRPATTVLEENGRKAKAEVTMSEAELADEALEESSSNTDAEADGIQLDVEAKKDDSSDMKPKPEAKKLAITAKEIKITGPDEPEAELSMEESDSVDEMTDADEAREEADAPVTVGRKGEKPQVNSPKSVTKGDKPKRWTARDAYIPDKTTKAFRGRTSSTMPYSKTTDRNSANRQMQARMNDDEVEREASIAYIQAKSPKIDRVASATNLRANTETPVPKKLIKRGVSSDRARHARIITPTGSPDCAVVKTALIRKAAPDSARLAKEEAKHARRQEEEAELLAEQRRYQKELQQQRRKDESDRRAEEREEQRTVRTEKRAWDAKRREDARKVIGNAANLKAICLTDLEEIRAQNQFVEHFNGISERSQKYDFDPTAPRGPSQTVTYTSRFVDRLSDVMDNMSVSGPQSIKAGSVGGSGKGSFVDSNEFTESDLNFYISVKVVNQTINFKDALVFNPLETVEGNNFREVYGDSFVSGFVEGGEFNAIISMKILNKAKKTDIQAEAKIALTAGAVQIEAEDNVRIARSNIEANTETTIHVSWSGGGHIKPMDQQWNIQSLMAAAARFPDLVADCPQRTYAILTKYDSLRSFVARKPALYTSLQYENAQIYTNTLLDSFVSYKALYKRIGEQIFGVQGKVLEMVPWSNNEKEKVIMMNSEDKKTGLYPFQELNSNFEASVKGLGDAQIAIRRQMARIVNEVDLIEKDPKIATDEDHTEPYQSPVAFEARIPTVEVPERLRVESHPLSGRRIAAKPLLEEEQKKHTREEEKLAECTKLYVSTDKLENDEKEAFDNLLRGSPVLGAHFRASSAVGDNGEGKPFNNLDFLKSDWIVRSIRTEMAHGALIYLAVSYENGLLVERGVSRERTRVKKLGPMLPGERVNSASIEHGRLKGEDKKVMSTQVLGLRLFTNRGRSLIARAFQSKLGENGIVIRDGVAYENVSVLYMDLPFNSGSIKGFFGRSDDGSDGKIYRLGIIWCRLPEINAEDAEVQFTDTGDAVDSEDLALLQKDQAFSSKSLKETQQKLIAAQKALEESRDNITKRDNQISELEEARDRKPTQLVGAQCGSFSATDKGWRDGENTAARCSVEFPHHYPTPPKLLFGLSNVDAECNKPRCLSLTFPEANAGGFSVQAAALNGCRGYQIGCNWLTLPEDLHLETGMIHTNGGDQPDYDSFNRQIFFSQSFASPPKLCVWIQEFEWHSTEFLSIKCSAADITSHSFNLKIESWANRRFKNARVQYLAYSAEDDGKRVKTGRYTIARPHKEVNNQYEFYGQPFKNTPKTFIAIAYMNFNGNRNLRFRCSANAPNKMELACSYGTWWDSDMYQAEVQWIAIE